MHTFHSNPARRSSRRRHLLAAGAAFLAMLCATGAQAADRIRFVTGPFRATEAETRAQWGPLVKYLGEQLGIETELTVTDDWAKVGAAMARDEYDVAWQGGAGRYVVSRSQGAGPAIATVKVAGSPVYHTLFLARTGLAINDFPRDARGMTLALTHENSTTGWLVPYAWLVAQGIDPKTYFKYSSGNQHPDNVLGVAKGSYDLASDSDANRNAMIAKGLVKEADTRVVWTSADVPQDPISVRNGLDAGLVQRLQQVLAAIDTERAKAIPMPTNYTGFVLAGDADYRSVLDASIAVGRIAKKP
jgi:phosphonate transport system substrate-binding protein